METSMVRRLCSSLASSWGASVVLGMLQRLEGREDAPLLRCLILRVRPVVDSVKVVVDRLLFHDRFLLRRLLSWVNHEHRMKRLLLLFHVSNPAMDCE
jgi:hypothetical protein